jgi:signal transduction histidine kinase
VHDILQTEISGSSLQATIDQLFEQEKWQGEVIQRCKDGAAIYILASLSMLKDSAGTPAGLVAINRDITGRKQAEESLRNQNRELALLNKSTQAFISTLDLDQVLTKVLEEVCDLLGVTGGSAWLVDPKTAELVCWQATTPEHVVPKNWRLAPRQGIVGWVVQHRQSLIVPDTRLDSRHYKAIDRETGLEMRSILCVPLLGQREVVGVLQMVDTTPHRFETTDIELVELLATTATIAIENASLFQALVDSERRYRDLFENSTIALWEEDFSGVLAYIEQLRQAGVKDFRAYFEQQPEAIIRCAALIQVIDVNRAAVNMCQAANKESLLGSLSRICTPRPGGIFVEELIAVAEKRTLFVGQDTYYTLTGNKMEVDLSWSVASGYEKSYEKVILSMRDVTEHKKLEQQLLQSQKIEAVGHLAGGVAHNFNNMLTAIMGYTGLALEALPAAHPAVADLQGILKTSERAAELTRQLLTFTRRQSIQPRLLNLNDLVLGMDSLLRQITKTDIELVTCLEPELGRVKVDANQFEQVLVNLALNARDAMPDGGRLVIETGNVTLDYIYTRQNIELYPGHYVMLAVQDTGVGMTEEVMAHIFEPFFTTKEVGQGTGLGLALCFGAVKQSKGHISVSSKPGEGTSFKIYLPRVKDSSPD